ncbi:MAG: endonuclease III [Puniceicoccales bacterium]|jgi:endonuclease-3|nr:endonuclease III [Puniceicoccales bacterium]
MNKSERARFVAQRLEELYPSPAVALEHTDAFTLLVAVVLSAQCTDRRVNLVTPELFSLARTPCAFARLRVADVGTVVHPCGLASRKAAALVALSRILCERHGGRVPASFAALEALPGVGHKTASVVMAQAFGVPAFPVDTHIHRLAARWRLSPGTNVVRTEHDLKKLFPARLWNTLHLRMIYYGREHCPARGCDGSCCPICRVVNGRAVRAGGRSRE